MKERTIITVVALIVIGVCAWSETISHDPGTGITIDDLVYWHEAIPGDLQQEYRTLLPETPYEVISYPPLVEPKTVTAPAECEQLKQENEYLKRENCLLRELVDVYHKLVNLLEGKS